MISFRALARSDLPTLRQWLNTPHVYEWWGRHAGPGSLGGPGMDGATEAQVEEKYGGAIDHDYTTHRFIIESDGARWYKTGDMGHLDADGFLTLADRD